MQGTPVSCEQLSLGIVSSGTENPGYPGQFKRRSATSLGSSRYGIETARLAEQLTFDAGTSNRVGQLGRTLS
jgi:hypothetical protein